MALPPVLSALAAAAPALCTDELLAGAVNGMVKQLGERIDRSVGWEI